MRATEGDGEGEGKWEGQAMGTPCRRPAYRPAVARAIWRLTPISIRMIPLRGTDPSPEQMQITELLANEAAALAAAEVPWASDRSYSLV